MLHSNSAHDRTIGLKFQGPSCVRLSSSRLGGHTGGALGQSSVRQARSTWTEPRASGPRCTSSSSRPSLHTRARSGWLLGGRAARWPRGPRYRILLGLFYLARTPAKRHPLDCRAIFTVRFLYVHGLARRLERLLRSSGWKKSDTL